jgi:hypothetical protein
MPRAKSCATSDESASPHCDREGIFGGDQTGRDSCVARRRRQVLVTERDLDDPDVGPALKQMRRKAMTQDVRAHPLVETGRMQAFGLMGLSWLRPRNNQFLGRAGRQ